MHIKKQENLFKNLSYKQIQIIWQCCFKERMSSKRFYFQGFFYRQLKSVKLMHSAAKIKDTCSTHIISTKVCCWKNSTYLGHLESILCVCVHCLLSVQQFYCISLPSRSPWFIGNGTFLAVCLKQWTIYTNTPVTFYFVSTELQWR